MAPNGIVELLEAELGIRTDDDSLPKEGHIETYLKHFWEAAKVVGLRDVTKDLEKSLLDAGFVDVKVVVKKLPIGPWPKNPKQKVSAARLAGLACGPVDLVFITTGTW